MAQRNGVIGGLSLGGILVIAGILLWLVFDAPLFGAVVAIVGLALGGFVRGKWY